VDTYVQIRQRWVAADPGLRLAHEAAAARKTMVTAPGLERMQQLVALVQETGRYPSTNAESTSERPGDVAPAPA
jgi:hypothetical protein